MAAEPRHLSIGFAGGGLSSLLLQLLRDWNSQVPSPVIEPAVDLLSNCQCSIFATWDLSERELGVLVIGILSERELGVLVIGILLGLLLLPVIELLLVVRQAWSVWLRQRLLGKQLYRTI